MTNKFMGGGKKIIQKNRQKVLPPCICFHALQGNYRKIH